MSYDYLIENAEIEFQGEDVFSLKYSDRYFSTDGALEEKFKIFIQGNDLEKRIETVENNLVVAELGLGCALNLFLTWKTWKEAPTSGKILNYIAYEKNPLTKNDLSRFWSNKHEFSYYLDKYLKTLNQTISGAHTFWLEDNFRVTLFLGDVNDYLPMLDARVDIWYLDGFSPSLNENLWNERIFREIGLKCNMDCTLTTYSSSSRIRKLLEDNNFKVEKLPGFARKKEFSKAVKISAEKTGEKNRGRKKKVVVIGAGLAGCAVSSSLAKRGYEVELIEKANDISQKASGNLAGILMPHISVKPDIMSRFFIAGFVYVMNQLNMNYENEDFFSTDGVLRLTSSDRLANLWKELAASKINKNFVQAVGEDVVAKLSGINLKSEALFFPEGGWLSPKTFAQKILEPYSSLITKIFYQEAITLQQEADSWLVLGADGRVISEAEILILANAYEAKKFSQTSWLPLEPVRGQGFTFVANQATSELKIPICYDGYVIPEFNSRHFVGATYNHQDAREEVDPLHTDDIYSRLYKWCPEFPAIDKSTIESRVSFRTMTIDRLPLVGSMPVIEDLKQLETNFNSGISQNFTKFKNFFVTTGYGSRGLIASGLSAEIIASEINSEPLPMEKDLSQALLPERFFSRSTYFKRIQAEKKCS